MSINKIGFILVALLLGVGMMAAQEQSEKTIKHVPIKGTSPVSGKDMYVAYCAVCHGTDGKGVGPAASALKVPPTDLSSLSKNNGGKYPSLRGYRCHPRRRGPSGPSIERHAGVGFFILEPEQRPRGRSPTARLEPYPLHRDPAEQVIVQP